MVPVQQDAGAKRKVRVARQDRRDDLWNLLRTLAAVRVDEHGDVGIRRERGDAGEAGSTVAAAGLAHDAGSCLPRDEGRRVGGSIVETITSSTTSPGTRRMSSPITRASLSAGTIKTVFIRRPRRHAREGSLPTRRATLEPPRTPEAPLRRGGPTTGWPRARQGRRRTRRRWCP